MQMNGTHSTGEDREEDQVQLEIWKYELKEEVFQEEFTQSGQSEIDCINTK